MKNFDFWYILGLKFSEEDFQNRQWFHFSDEGEQNIEIYNRLFKVKPGKNERSIVHNYLKFWFIYHYLQRASYDFITFFYFFAKRFEPEIDINLASLMRKIAGVLMQDLKDIII